MSKRELLESKKWERPEYYAGFNPDMDYLLYARHRESQLVEESNMAVIRRELDKIIAALPQDQREPVPTDAAEMEAFGMAKSEATTREFWVYSWRASHPMVGWVEYLMLRGDAPDALKDKAESMLKGLEGYPIADDDHYSDLQTEAIDKYWDGASESERKSWFEGTEHAFDPADPTAMPEQVRDKLYESEMFY